jgi:hypothetical protein
MRKIIVLLKYSQEYAKNLINQNQALNIKGHQKIGLDSSIRWNSTCKFYFTLCLFYIFKFTDFLKTDNMLDDFLHLKKSIEIILYSTPKLRYLELFENEWLLLERYHKLFNIFRKPTIKLQAEKYPTIQTVLPYIYLCRDALNEFIQFELTDELKNACKKGLQKMDRYFPKKMKWQNYNNYIFAILLDPRCKLQMLEKLNFDENIRRDIRSEFYKKFNE